MLLRSFLVVFGLVLTLSISTKAQTVQWASEVVEVSSELTPIQYAAKQALGKPDVLPKGGESPNAWTPDRANNKEFIKVGFENPMQIKLIAVAESYNPTAVTAIYLYDEAGNEYLANTFVGRELPLKGRMLNFFYQTEYKVAAVKLELDGSLVSEYFSIDAIAISDSEIPIVAEVITPAYLEAGVVVERLSDNINSEYKEYKPVLSPDGTTMWFSRQFHPENVGGVGDPEDIWVSKLDSNGDWTLAQNAGGVVNTAGPNFISAITPDGKTAIMGNKYLDNGQMEDGVSMSSLVGGEWTKPVTMIIENEYNFNDRANYYLANSRTSLLMSVERSDTQGDRDLYVSFMNKDSTWTEPLNLGDVINSAGEESAPFLAADDVTLYFSSNGFSGYGGNDIYTSKRLDDTWTNWSEPQNMGPDINSEFEDLFFNIPAESNIAFYSRGVTADDTDIFRMELPLFQRPDPTIIVKGQLFNSQTRDPVGARITYERLSDGKQLGIIQSDPITGEYEIVLPVGEVYAIHAEADGFISQSTTIDLTEVTGEVFEIDHKDIVMVPVKKDVTVTLNNLFFDFDEAVLRNESFAELDRLIDYMEEYPQMEIEIAGHTDTSGPELYNMDLSRRRAQSVMDYLLEKGVSESRVSMVYFGETKPLVSNETREGRIKNRRVEFVIKKE